MRAAAQRDTPNTLLMAARLASFAVICLALYFGQVVLIPIALAALITFLMSPLVARLDHWGLPRIVSVMVVTGSLTGLIGGLGYVVVGELGELAEELPTHRQNIRSKMADLRAMTRGGTIERVQRTIEQLSEDVEQDAAAENPQPDAPAGADQDDEPVRVAIEAETQLLDEAVFLGPVLEAVATGGLTMLLSIFMLIKREDLRNRLVSLAGQSSLVVTTKAFAEAGRRISRYLLMQFFINASMGLAVGVGLYLIGVPYAALWGLSAAVLRYIPYVGPWVAALLPIAISIMTAPGWEQVLLVVSLFVVLELFSNNVMEPWLYGQSVGLSAMAVVVSAIFWTWLWGPVGLVLATPITACVVVLARYIPALGAFDRLLSERPALQPHLWLYQRLLARDEDEAGEIIDKYTAEQPLVQTCDELLLGTLTALKRDLCAGTIAPEDGEFVVSALQEIIDDLPPPPTESAEGGPVRQFEGEAVLLIGSPGDELDSIALRLLAVVLRDEHCDLEILPHEMLIGERIAQVEAQRPAAVCIPSLPPGDLTPTRHASKRLRARLPALKLIVGRLGDQQAPVRSTRILRGAGAQQVAASLAEMREALLPIVREARSAAAAAESAKSHEEAEAEPEAARPAKSNEPPNREPSAPASSAAAPALDPKPA
jgi:predicted PurR-regulated permease PerM